MGKVKLRAALSAKLSAATSPVKSRIVALPMKLRATSLVECVVAAVIFLLVFSLSLDTIAGFKAGRREELSLLAAESALQRALRTYGDGTHPEGVHTREFDWGEVEVRITRYGEYNDLQELTLSASVRGDRKTIRQKYIIKTAHDWSVAE